MKLLFKMAMVLMVIASSSAMAHIGYGNTSATGRDFGSFDGSTTETAIKNATTASGNFGWVDGTDADFGDSHKVRFYRFSLTNSANVAINVAGDSSISTSAGALTPGFSLYSGLAHGTPENPGAADYDFATGSFVIRANASPNFTEGSFRAQNTWQLTNNDDPTGSSPSTFSYIGSAYDGSQNNGNGIVAQGDGIQDSIVGKQFLLGPGNYSIAIGGSDYSTQTTNDGLSAATFTGSFGYVPSITVSPVPEPETYFMMLTGLAAVAGKLRRRRISA